MARRLEGMISLLALAQTIPSLEVLCRYVRLAWRGTYGVLSGK